ncbi:LOW QUALITY PROTEIN: hypothetical protein NC652_002883 [Populus alba x Populus x berolinensis]|nr:LOW QUALITY PROTEIN: hypothetical protein NC652_002883 [Populus alba x Populus x berolinensis]
MVAANGHLDIVEYLISQGVYFASIDIDHKGLEHVCLFVFFLSLDLILIVTALTYQILVTSIEQDLNSANKEKNTALHWACLNGHIEVVKKLILAGSSLGFLNSHERTQWMKLLLGKKWMLLMQLMQLWHSWNLLDDKDVEGGLVSEDFVKEFPSRSILNYAWHLMMMLPNHKRPKSFLFVWVENLNLSISISGRQGFLSLWMLLKQNSESQMGFSPLICGGT